MARTVVSAALQAVAPVRAPARRRPQRPVRRTQEMRSADAQRRPDTRGGPEFSEAMTKLGAALDEADAAMATRNSTTLPEVAARIRRALAPIEAPVRDLRPAIRAFYAESNDRVQRRLSSYLTAIVGLLALGAGGALLFVLLYARQHRRLRESEETFRATFDRAGVGIAHLSPGGRWLRVNATLCQLAGRELDTLLVGCSARRAQAALTHVCLEMHPVA